MKSAKGQVGAVLDRPNPATRFYLFHGADEAGSRTLAARLLAALVAEKVPLSASVLRSDPAALVDEAAAISMFGDKRLLWIEPAGNDIVVAVQALLEAAAVESRAVAIAGALPKSSPLLKLAEAHPAALSHVSYVPEGHDADRMVLDLGRQQGLRMTPAVAARIAAAAANDGAVAKQELAKFALYLGATAAAPRDLGDEVIALLGADGSDGDAGRVGDLALSGDLARLGEALERMESNGIEAIPVVRWLQRRLLQLLPLRTRIDGGQSPEAVMTSLFWRDKALFQKLLVRWTSERLAQAIERVARLERQLLLAPVPDRAALGEELMQIARAASR